MPAQHSIGTMPQRRALPRGWQAYALFLPLPLWWALGLSHFIWPVIAAGLLLSLLLRAESLRLPRGFGIWLLFLAWMVASATQIDTVGRFAGFLLRLSIYVAATIVFLYLYNRREMVPARTIVYALAGYWLVVVGGGYLGIFFPNVSFTTPAAHLIPGSIANNQVVQDMITAKFADVQTFLGYPLGRPQTFFTYTNGWGSGFAFLTPFAFGAIAQTMSRTWRRIFQIGLVASVFPLIVSLNRGAWLSLGVAIAYVLIRLAWQQDVRALGRVVIGVAICSLVIVVSPLQGLIGQRLAHGQSNGARRALYAETFHRVAKSPILGYGAPRPAESQSYLDSVGTQGQLLYLMFSHGIPGVILFLAWFGVVFVRTARIRAGPGFWAHVAILIALVEAPFYTLSLQLVVIMVAAALALRELDSEPEVAASRARSRLSFADHGLAVPGP